MRKDSITINRIIDANINRAKEGLRVCEEITRFILESRRLSFQFKRIRHKIEFTLKGLPVNFSLLKGRDSLKDVGRTIHAFELKRRNFKDVFFANLQRVKDSVRVLEEFAKLKSHKPGGNGLASNSQSHKAALYFKKIRYELYEIEKTAAKKISSLRYP